jgi:hypothetical protein
MALNINNTEYIIENIYCNQTSAWILDLNESEIDVNAIQHRLVLNNRVSKEVRWLDKFVGKLSGLEYVSMAWSCIPKQTKVPFVTELVKPKVFVNYDSILAKIRKHYKFSDNDWAYNKAVILNDFNQTHIKPWLDYFKARNKDYEYFRIHKG